MKRPRKDRVTNCIFNPTEQGQVDLVAGLCHQLAYHYKHTSFGVRMADVVTALTDLLADPDICPPAADGKKAKGETNVDTD